MHGSRMWMGPAEIHRLQMVLRPFHLGFEEVCPRPPGVDLRHHLLEVV